MKNIDILIAVDGAKLATQVSDQKLSPGTLTKPTSLGSYKDSDVYIAMISENSSVVNDGGGSELTVKANSRDIITWTITTFDGNADYTAYLYAGNFNPAGNIAPLAYGLEESSEYLPAANDPTVTPTLQHSWVYTATATVQRPGAQIQYTLSFALTDNGNNGNVIGYFVWDPFINVSP